ncbi:hypothetical protein I6F15_00180 [Bradyrhizobium sp. BRP14]|nr:hypothetical protein [Bradyrhizobium sp. BRP14]
MNGFGRLVLTLSSDQDGEVVAAARALGKALRKAGHDWHWLAALVDGEPQQQQQGIEDHQVAAEWLLTHVRHRLRPNEIDFLQTMEGWLGDPTPRQAAWLAKLCARWGYQP